jgi:uncharacterized membrane protein
LPPSGSGEDIALNTASSQNRCPMSSPGKAGSNWIIAVIFGFFLLLIIWIFLYYNLKMKEIDLMIEQIRSQTEIPVTLKKP